ncbi:MAG TPA: hypothetical protein VHX20_00860 [Terracidiphilus sp.]|jgi:hypothetical protein|nr:hypothetical protein [Terracidiphilus sp.]
MNVQSPDPISNRYPDAENTLRLLAALPPPQGLEARIHAVLASPHRPHQQSARLLAWPARGVQRVWLRSAAAAAIAFVVVGGGWGVYSSIQPRMQPWQPGGAVPALPQLSGPGGFSGAGAIRTPQTLNGPVLSHTVKTHETQAGTTNRKASKSAAPGFASQNLASHNSATRDSGTHNSGRHNSGTRNSGPGNSSPVASPAHE